MGTITINTNILLWVAGAIITLSTAGGVIYKVAKKIAKNLTKETIDEEIDNEVQEMGAVIDDINKTLNEVQASLNAYIEKSNKDMADIKKTLRDQIRERIMHIHNECIKNGEISQHQLFMVEELYSDYHDILNGNSFVDGLMEDLRELKRVQ